MVLKRKDLVIRPSFHTWRNRFITVLVVIVGYSAVNVWAAWKRGGPVERELVVLLYASLIVVILLVVLLVFQREELVVADGFLTRRNLLGMPRRYGLDAIGGMARRDVMFLGAREPSHYVVVYDKQNHCLFKMNRAIWDPADVKRLHALLGGDGRARLVTMSEVEEEFPGTVAWLITHPLVLIAVEVVVLLVLLFALVSLTDAMTSKL